MSGFRVPGVIGRHTSPIDEGTHARWAMPPPGTVGMTPLAVRQAPDHSRARNLATSTLTMSTQAIALLKGIESLRLQPYNDQTGKVISVWVKGATIGYGHLISEREWPTYKNGITLAQADDLLRTDIAPFERTVRDNSPVAQQQHEFDALVILAFNIGSAGFRSSAVARLVNEPHSTARQASLEAAWKSWNKSQGKLSPGLINRRAAEWRIYTSAMYARW